MSHGSDGSVILRRLRNILSYTDHTNDVAIGVSASGSIDKKVPSFVTLGAELELVVRRLVSMQSVVENSLNRFLKLRLNESRYHGSIKRLFLGEAGDLGGLVVPLIDIAVHVDAKNGSIRCID